MNGSFGDKANHSVPLVEEAEEFADEIVSVDLNTVKKEISIHDTELTQEDLHPVVKKAKLAKKEKSAKKMPVLHQSKLPASMVIQRKIYKVDKS